MLQIVLKTVLPGTSYLVPILAQRYGRFPYTAWRRPWVLGALGGWSRPQAWGCLAEEPTHHSLHRESAGFQSTENLS